MSDIFNGACLCGDVTYRIEAEPIVKLACHCSGCQKQTGTSFAAIMGFPKNKMTIEGTLKSYTSKGGSGEPLKRHFCPKCGSGIYSDVGVVPGMVMIRVGNLDDPSVFTPDAHIHCGKKSHWIKLGDAVQFEAAPGKAAGNLSEKVAQADQ
mgnify:CR=1 FL=1